MSSCDLLIIGAGPVGLTLAAECRRYGIGFRIVDRNAGCSTHSKALVIWSGTLEHLASLGLAEKFIQAGRPVRRMIFQNQGNPLAEIPITEGLESLYPSPLILPQSRTEELLSAHLAEQSINVERNVECVGLSQTQDEVTCELRSSDGKVEAVSAAWVAGCDGARSIARHQLNVGFAGATEKMSFILADAEVQGELPDDAILVSSGPRGNIIIFPVKAGIWRFFALREDTTNLEQPTLQEIQEHVNDAGLERIRLSNPEWLSHFLVNERVVSRSRLGRVFLLGDAAHIHSPAGGQGMNTGMQDAFNLGWKLKLLTSKIGDAEQIAESYFAERHPVAEKVVRNTSRLLHFGLISSPVFRKAREIALPLLSRIETAKERLAFELSELGISYSDSPLIERSSSGFHHPRGLRPGTLARDVTVQKSGTPTSLWRELLHPGHTLLLFPGSSATEEQIQFFSDLSEALRDSTTCSIVVWQSGVEPKSKHSTCCVLDPDGAAHARYGLREPGWYLIRPDQYIAARGTNADISSLKDYWRKVQGELQVAP
jgi:2-polyprenyl-6-methoxyphenol hydroxylase-like FAD-dependent oxidoreductase